MNEEKRPILEIEDAEWTDSSRRARRKKAYLIAFGMLLAVGVCLAVALPLTLGAESKQEIESELFYPKPLMLVAIRPGSKDEGIFTATENPKITHSDDENDNDDDDRTHHHHDRHTHRTHRTRHPYESTEATTHRHRPTLWTTTEHTTIKPYSYSECPDIDPSERGLIDLGRFEGKTLYQVARIQSSNSPAFLDNPSCVRVQTPRKRENLVNVTWEEGRRRHLEIKYATFELEGTQRENDWIEKMKEPFNNTERYDSYLSVVGQWGDYLLTYNCYPNMLLRHSPPGYVITVLTAASEDFSHTVTESLFDLAHNLHLNPGFYKPKYIRQSYCMQDRHDHNDSDEEDDSGK